MAKIRKIWILAGLLCITSPSVLGYIDPGTGGMLLGSVWPFIAMIGAAIGGILLKVFYRPIKKVVLKPIELIKRKK